jgi:hypothetical protein
MRSLRALKALQAEPRAQAKAGAQAQAPARAPVRLVRPASAAARPDRPAARAKQPDEPERRMDPGECGRPADRAHPAGAPPGRDSAGISPLPLPTRKMLGTRKAIARAGQPWSENTLNPVA